MKIILWFCIISLIGFTSCIQDLDDWLQTSDINFKRKAETKYFSKDYASFDVIRIKNDLKIHFTWQAPDNFPFPIDENSKDTLPVTNFSYRFKENNTVIRVDNIKHYKSTLRKWEMDSLNFIITTPKQNLRYLVSEELIIPLYYFYNLKAGKHEITVDIYQTTFTSQTDDKKLDLAALTTSEKNAELIKGSIYFTINIPEINRTDIYTNGLELQNDSSFSPSGMDFSLTTPGYPDVYWELFFPVTSETDLSSPCFISSVARSSTHRLDPDTVILYHYSGNDKIIIGVYDQDVITRDDFLGDWYGSLKLCESSNGGFKKLAFDHVAWFSILAEPKGVINK